MDTSKLLPFIKVSLPKGAQNDQTGHQKSNKVRYVKCFASTSYKRNRYHRSEASLPNGAQKYQIDHQTYNKAHYLKEYHIKQSEKVHFMKKFKT